MPVVGSAAAAEDVEARGHGAAEARVEVGHSAGLPRSSSAASFSSAWLLCEALARRPRMRPRAGRLERAGEVSGMRAVDHVIGRLAAGGIVHLPDGIRQQLAGGKRAIGLGLKEMATGRRKSAAARTTPIASAA